MISKSDKKLLNETFRNASMGIEAIYSVLDRVNDEEMALELTRQIGKFTSIQDRAFDELMLQGEKPKESVFGKMKLKMDIFRKTMGRKSASHIANMMIQGNSKGIVDTTRIIHDSNEAKKEYCELAGELTNFEEKNIERMKLYL